MRPVSSTRTPARRWAALNGVLLWVLAVLGAVIPVAVILMMVAGPGWGDVVRTRVFWPVAITIFITAALSVATALLARRARTRAREHDTA